MNRVAIIPARGGSKRIHRKNIKEFLGKPIIAYSIEAALKSGLFDEVMVSTDDHEIAELSKNYGASIPFFRKAETANDFATTADVLEEVLNEYKKSGSKFEYACCIYPAAPLIQIKKLKTALDLIVSKQFDCVFPVVKYSHPIWRSVRIEEGKALMNWSQYLNSRSQDLPPAFHDAGQFYWFKVTSFLKTLSLFTKNSGVVELDELEVQDIDRITDWKIAELKYQLLKNNENKGYFPC
jgi:pseudaminic acid cytidylyltransferase